MVGGIIKTYRDAFSGLPTPIWILCSAGLINRAGTMVLPFMSIYLTTARGLSVADAGWILMAFGMGSVFGSYFGGKLCARLGFLNILTGSLLSAGVGFICLGFATTFWSLFTGFFALSLLGDAFRPAIMTAISLHSKGKTAKSMALLRLSINLGMAIGPAVGGALASINFSYLFRVDGLTCLVAGLFLLRFRRLLTVESIPPEPDSLSAKSREVLRDIPFVIFLFLMLGLSFCFFQIIGAYPLYLKQVFGYMEDDIGLILALNALLIVLFEMVLIHQTQHLNPMILFSLGVFLVGIGFGFIPLCRFFPETLWLRTTILIGLTVIWTAGEMLALPMANTIVSNRASRVDAGSYMAWYTTTWALSMMIAPSFGLFLMKEFGVDTIWWVVIIVSAIVMAGALKLKPHMTQPEPETEVRFGA